MCGIAGQISFDDVTPDAGRLAAMSACLPHRGPDAADQFVGPGVGMAFRRLAIIDLDPRSMQPMLDPDGRYVMVFNGEIYNYRQLRGELVDYPFRTESDSEVLLAALIRWGVDALAKLDGMFAFAFYDRRERTLVLARDRLGQKPLYVRGLRFTGDIAERTAGPVIFASELSALIAAGVDVALSDATLATYLSLGYVPSGTAIGEASKLPPGVVVRVTAESATSHRYFDPAGTIVEPDAEDEDALPGRVKSLIDAAVARQMVSDVPLGCFLSGGIDSSIIAASMVRAAGSGENVKTFCIGFDSPEYDETEHAAAVAKHLGTTHKSFRVTPDAAADLPSLATACGEPFADSSILPTYYLSRMTRGHVTVALSGDGGDELFGGYDRYRAVALGEMLEKVPRWLRSTVAGTLRPLLPSTHPRRRTARLKRFLDTAALDAGQRYASYMRLFSPAQVRTLLKSAAEPFDDLAERYAGHLKHRPAVPAALALDRETYLPDDLHTKVDRASMQVSLEVRSPFMDVAVLELAKSLPPELLVGKRLLKEAFAGDLPTEVFARKKTGFAVPIGEWFRGELKPMLRETLLAERSICRKRLDIAAVEKLIDEHEKETSDHTQRLFALLMLELSPAATAG